MKQLIPTLIFCIGIGQFYGQTDTINVDVENDKVKIVVDTTSVLVKTEKSDDDEVYIRINDIEVSIPDTTVIQFGSYSIEINEDYAEITRTDKEDKKKGRKSSWRQMTNWAGIDIGVNGYVTPDFDFEVEEGDEFMALNWGNSRTFSVNPVEWKIKLFQDYIGITTGLGIEWNNYRLRNLNYRLEFNADSTYGVWEEDKGVNKSKFRLTYINAPLLLEFNTSPYRSKSFHIAAGVIVGWRINTMYKQRYRNDGKHKDRTFGSHNMQPFRFNAAVRVGYGRVNLFATYSLNQMFREGAGPELHMVSVGITVVGW
jgi:hypothetical protein